MASRKFDVSRALLSAVQGLDLAYPIKYPNGNFYTGTTASEQPNNDPWLRVTDLPGLTVQQSLGSNGQDNQPGILQIDIFTAIGSSDIKAVQIVDEIETLIYSGRVLTYNDVNVRVRNVSIRVGEQAESWFSKIIEIEYYAYLARVTA